jgi:hypothetical protein
MVKLADLGQYLKEQIPLIEKAKPISDKMKEYLEALNSISEYEASNLSLIQAIKDPRTHSGSGVINLYQGYEKLLFGLKNQESSIGNGYKIKIDGMMLNITPKNTTEIWRYRLKWADKALKGLFFIYKDEAREFIDETEATLSRAVSRYRL